MTVPPIPLRLRIDGDALVANWRWLQGKSGSAACGAAVKADGYGLGAREVVRRLMQAGCRDFFVATWAEAHALRDLFESGGVKLSVLHGPGPEDMTYARDSVAVPVLNSASQVARWRDTGRPCDVMIDTGMNRLGLSADAVRGGLLDGLAIDTVMSHLASADENVASNAAQREAFIHASAQVQAPRRSLANSAGICLGVDYAFDLTRPGLALYGGIPRAEAKGSIRQVVRLEAQVIQRRELQAGQAIGYNGTYVADRTRQVAILNLGYADGYLRAFSGKGKVLGRVSMDLTAVSVDDALQVGEGDWVEIPYDLSGAAASSGLSQYELLTGLSQRFTRLWT